MHRQILCRRKCTDPFVVQLWVVQQDSTHVRIKFHHHTNVPEAKQKYSIFFILTNGNINKIQTTCLIWVFNWHHVLFYRKHRYCMNLPDLSDGGCVDCSKLQLLFLLQCKNTNTHVHVWTCCKHTYKQLPVQFNVRLLVKVVDTHVIFAEVADELLGFVHGSWCWSEHRESLLVHLIYRHALRRKKTNKSPVSTFCKIKNELCSRRKNCKTVLHLQTVSLNTLPVWACSLRRLYPPGPTKRARLETGTRMFSEDRVKLYQYCLICSIILMPRPFPSSSCHPDSTFNVNAMSS